MSDELVADAVRQALDEIPDHANIQAVVVIMDIATNHGTTTIVTTSPQISANWLTGICITATRGSS